MNADVFFDTNVLVYATAKDDARAATAIVASALEAHCKTLLSEEMQDGRVIDGSLTIRNPFGA